MRDGTSKAMERRAAAGGNFNAGASMRQQGEAVADFSAQEFKDRGALAGAAQAARGTRLSDLTGEAKTYEDTVLANREFNLKAAGQQDQFGRSGEGLLAQLGIASDTSQLKNQEDIDALAGKSSDEYNRQQESLDTLARTSDVSEGERRQKYVDYLKDLGVQGDTKIKGGLDVATGLDSQDRLNRNDLYDQSKGASDEVQKNKDYLRSLAKDSSDEARNAEQDRLQAMGKLAMERAGIAEKYDMAGGGALSEAETNAIDIELKKAGYDAETRQKVLNNTLGAVKTAISAYTGLGAGAGSAAGGGAQGGDDPYKW